MLIVALANIGRLQRELERMQESLVLILAAINSRRKASENVEVPVETPKPEEKPAEEVPMEDVVDEEDVEECIAPVPDQPRPVPRALFENDPPAFVRNPEPMASFEPVKPVAESREEPTAIDIFWRKVEDWFCVRGDFAPKGVTREFAVATRWLTRVGALLLVGALHDSRREQVVPCGARRRADGLRIPARQFRRKIALRRVHRGARERETDGDVGVAAPINGAVAANANVAAPIDASVAANVGSIDSDAVSIADQDAIINQSIEGSATADAGQASDISQP
jgi:hypothetical protein